MGEINRLSQNRAAAEASRQEIGIHVGMWPQDILIDRTEAMTISNPYFVQVGTEVSIEHVIWLEAEFASLQKF